MNSSHQHQALKGTSWLTGGRGMGSLTSPAPRAPANIGTDLSKSATGDFIPYKLSQKTLGFEAGNLSHNARLRSRGESHLAANDMAVDDGIEREDFFFRFRVHRRRDLCQN